jgi:hypothetical protein
MGRAKTTSGPPLDYALRQTESAGVVRREARDPQSQHEDVSTMR